MKGSKYGTISNFKNTEIFYVYKDDYLFNIQFNLKKKLNGVNLIFLFSYFLKFTITYRGDASPFHQTV